MYVITLSSIPPRFPDLPRVIEALLAQRQPAAEVRLYLPRRYRRFPDWDGQLPTLPRGVALHRVEEDLGPATKVLFAARDLRGEDLDLLYCDDDRLYTPIWAETLLAARRSQPRAAIAVQGFHLRHLGLPELTEPAPRMKRGRGKRDPVYRLHKAWQRLRYGDDVPPFLRARPRSYARSGYMDIAEGLSGVLIRPEFLDDTALEIPEPLRAVDDIWLSGQMARLGIPVWLTATRRRLFVDLPSQTEETALHRVAGNDGRDALNRRCVAYLQERYGIW